MNDEQQAFCDELRALAEKHEVKTLVCLTDIDAGTMTTVGAKHALVGLITLALQELMSEEG